MQIQFLDVEKNIVSLSKRRRDIIYDDSDTYKGIINGPCSENPALDSECKIGFFRVPPKKPYVPIDISFRAFSLQTFSTVEVRSVQNCPLRSGLTIDI